MNDIFIGKVTFLWVKLFKTHSEMFKDILFWMFWNLFKDFIARHMLGFQKGLLMSQKLCLKVNGVSWNISTIFSLFKQSHYISVYHILWIFFFIYYHLQEMSQRITRCYIILTLKQKQEIKIRNKNDKKVYIQWNWFLWSFIFKSMVCMECWSN